MQLSKTAYYADFAIYAIVLLVLISIAGLSADWAERLKWVAAFTTGGATWTFLEYLLHRFVLHRLPILTAMHAVHHASPRAFVGTPTWLTLAILWLVFFLPTWWGFLFNVASGLIAGVMMRFLWYGILHDAIHHGRPRALGALVSTCAHRHQQHHFSGQPGNFGVTIPLWDYLFGTVIHGRRVDQPRGGQKKAPIRTPAADN